MNVVQKILFILLMAGLVAGCTAPAVTTLSYSGPFKLDIPIREFEGATIFHTEQLSVKTRSGALISGMALTHQTEEFPQDFNLQDYPEYLFRLRSAEALSESLAEYFRNSSQETDQFYGLDNLHRIERSGYRIYSACKTEKCLALVVKKDVKNQILVLNADKLEPGSFEELINGLKDVAY